MFWGKKHCSYLILNQCNRKILGHIQIARKVLLVVMFEKRFTFTKTKKRIKRKDVLEHQLFASCQCCRKQKLKPGPYINSKQE